ncbi:hypothetical protein QCM80_14770 [Bradyrhizobium sp. SSUT112]|uniref:hypothetical protein n=1 Tax=Bradyrhizobium sp. SSUT112 TaxID=3040604 RepID=UPI00244AF37F|nr:hypothetical protein [Bradyrhizobium sp. SSUT112]MDH2351917.1 hypothetical protein [Bradyrhizobium sp. SSUT112]
MDSYPLPLMANAKRRFTVSKRSFEVPYWNILQRSVQMLEMRDMTHSPTNEGARGYPAEKARQGEIILRKPWMRVVFIAGLVGCMLLVLGIRIAAGL